MNYIESRSIDDLGRVVIPKEIRRNLEIKENNFLDIYLDGDNIILKKAKAKGNSELDDRIKVIMRELFPYVNRPDQISEIISCIEEIRKIILDGME